MHVQESPSSERITASGSQQQRSEQRETIDQGLDEAVDGLEVIMEVLSACLEALEAETREDIPNDMPPSRTYVQQKQRVCQRLIALLHRQLGSLAEDLFEPLATERQH